MKQQKEKKIEHYFEPGKKVNTKGKVKGYYYLCKICKRKAFDHSNWAENLMRLGEKIGKEDEQQRIWSKNELRELINQVLYEKFS